jgi:DNA-binding SARP family transcriptional activator
VGGPPRVASREPAEEGFVVTLFGPGGVRRRGDGAVLVWHLRRAFEVLAYLATSPQLQAGRDELQRAVFWDASPEEVRKNFHPTLSHLRRALEGPPSPGRRLEVPPLLHLQGFYRLNPAIVWEVDALAFEERVIAGREHERAGRGEEAVAAWQAAWRLHAGVFLARLADPWVEARRERFQRLHLELLGGLGELFGRLGRLDDAVDALRAALFEDPLQERVSLELMRVYARMGRRDFVRRQYARLAADLRRELSVEPLPEVTAEYHRLMG